MKALITGITGQDGSYLAEFLLKKGYEVYGMYRRSSVETFERINHIKNKIKLICADLTDQSSLNSTVRDVNPDEVYNLAAQSFVPESWTQPILTGDVTALGALRILEAIRHVNPKIRFYQASSSEMFGKVQEVPQTEKTPFYPRSPYGVAKVYAFWMAKNYRESYGMFCANGILFNHECVSENTVVIIRENGFISVKRLKDLRKPKEKGRNLQQWKIDGIEIWDGASFVSLRFITATKRKKIEDHECKTINTRHGIVEATNHHNMVDSKGKEIKAKDVNIGLKLLHGNFPIPLGHTVISKDEAKLIGMMVADGRISTDGRGTLINNDKEILKEFEELWRNICFGTVNIDTRKSGFGGTSTRLCLNRNSNYLIYLRKQIYSSDGFKKVPKRILNSNKETQLAFLEGYNKCDGLKSNPCTYKFKNFKTNSPLLAQGLLFLLNQVTGQDFNITFEYDEKYYGYYSINLLSLIDNKKKANGVADLLNAGKSQREISRLTKVSRDSIRKIQSGKPVFLAHYLSKPKEDVKKIFYHRDQPGWVFDIETGSGKFMAGVGTIIVSNSPRRGKQFVTRKVTDSAAEIKLGLLKEVALGNLEAKRDWGYAGDYVEAMWLMLQHDKPDDFVIATGETHSVKELCEAAFSHAGLNYKDYVKTDPKFFRPVDVELLIGDPTKAKKELGWEPKVKFKELIEMMVDADLEKHKKEQR